MSHSICRWLTGSYTEKHQVLFVICISCCSVPLPQSSEWVGKMQFAGLYLVLFEDCFVVTSGKSSAITGDNLCLFTGLLSIWYPGMPLLPPKIVTYSKTLVMLRNNIKTDVDLLGEKILFFCLIHIKLRQGSWWNCPPPLVTF